MEEEDPVVQEIPVFLSQALSKNLYIYQYPARPANRDWKEVKVTNASVKPKNQMVRLEVELDTYSDKYCVSKGEQIALNTDGNVESTRFNKDRDKEKSVYFKSGIMDKIVYESSTPCIDTKHYAVAILQDKELHCTPVQGVIQMRPTYTYYDKQDKRKQEKNKADGSDDEEMEPEAKQVTVKFARQETEVTKKAREKSFETIAHKIAEEPWYDALWKHADSEYADLERLKLFSATSSSGSTLSVPAKEYVRLLVPAPPADEVDGSTTTILPPEKQIENLLVNAKMMTFNDIRALVRTESGLMSESALLAALGAVACCVRGVWTARASLSAHRSHALQHALYLFTQHPYIDRRKFAAAVRLPPQEVLEILQSVAKYNPRVGGWEMIIPPDTAFEAKYPDVMQRQNLYWEARQRQFNEMMVEEIVPKRQRKKSQRDSVSSDTMMSPKPRCNSVSEDDSDKRRHKSKGGGKRTRNISSSSVNET